MAAETSSGAYADAGGPARVRDLGDLSMLVAVQGHLVVGGAGKDVLDVLAGR